MFGSVTDTTMVHVPYKGGAPAMQDLLGSRVDLIFAPVPEALAHIKGAKLRALAVMSAKRTPVLQDVPTMQEAGHAGLELETWIGLLAPAGTPRDIVAKLNATLEKAMAGDLRDRFAEVGLSAAGGTPEQFAASIREDTATYAKLVKTSGMAIQ
jgi:tripartite-type tricarboxylate transporter receptor subunit TctC